MNSQADASRDSAANGQSASSPFDEAPDAPSATMAPADETTLEMRQVAGLTAGSVMVLHTGSFQFRESEKDVGFSLVVEGPDRVTVVGGSATSLIDEVPVGEPTPLGDAVLNVGSACFTVREPRPEPTNANRLNDLESARKPPSAIAVPWFDESPDEPVQSGSSRFGSLFSRGVDNEEGGFDAQTWQFLEAIRDTRSQVAERHRKLHPDPEELHSRLTRMDPGLWDRTVDNPMFSRFPIAFSTIPWEPRFDEPERIPEQLYEPIQEMSCLPWVPITANLLFGPLGIVGGRSAVLSCARNALLYLACVTAPSDIAFSIVTAQGLVEDWDWSSSLPNSLFPTDDGKYRIAIADGMTHFEGAGFSHEAVKNNEMGLIVLAESVDDLPDYCGTVLEITSDGQCRVTNHLGEQITGTPIGVTTRFAASLAGMVREAVGDGPPDDEVDAAESVHEPAEEPERQPDRPILRSVPPLDDVDQDDIDQDDIDQDAGDDREDPARDEAEPLRSARTSGDLDRWSEVPPIDDLIDLDQDDAEYAAKRGLESDDEEIDFEDEHPDDAVAAVPGSEPTIEIAAIQAPPSPAAVNDEPDAEDLTFDVQPFDDRPDLDRPVDHEDEDEDEEEEDLDTISEEVARALAENPFDPD
ncbi:MAG: hypothetical protein AAGA65_24755 [Actinomycetota bacterium]